MTPIFRESITGAIKIKKNKEIAHLHKNQHETPQRSGAGCPPAFETHPAAHARRDATMAKQLFDAFYAQLAMVLFWLPKIQP